MAADILLYDATHVPVGEDQKQHLELSRDIANKFNLDFNVPNFFKVPDPLIQKNFSRIMSLKDGTKKMSKSDPSDLSRINLTDTKEEILNKIKKAKTDTMPIPNEISELKKRPEVENLLGIYSSLNSQTTEKTINEFSGKNFSDFKEKLAELDIEFQRALETSADTSTIVAKKQALRDAPADSAIDAATDEAGLKSQWNTSILGSSPYS